MTMESAMSPNDPLSDTPDSVSYAANSFGSNKRLAAREATLSDKNILDCTVYRPDDHDPEGDADDLGDAKLLFTGEFKIPAEWDEEARTDFFGELAPELFSMARIESEAGPGTSGFFMPEAGDLIAAMPGAGVVEMFYVYDYTEDEGGRHYVLVREIDPTL
jgi:hypothetical protein